MNLLPVTEFASFLTAALFLGVGSWFDLKTREVPDQVWLVCGPVGGLLTALRVLFEPSIGVISLESIGASIVIALVLFYSGVFGGADSKAVICLGVTLPVAPVFYHPPLGYVQPFFPVAVFILGVLSSGSVALWIGLRNLITSTVNGTSFYDGLADEPRWKKAWAFVSGYPTSLSNLKSTFYLYPMEEVVDTGETASRRFQLFLRAEADRDELMSKFVASLTKVGSPNEIWVSPGLPMLLFIFIGFLIALLVGDPIL